VDAVAASDLSPEEQAQAERIPPTIHAYLAPRIESDDYEQQLAALHGCTPWARIRGRRTVTR
jgi:hypothetical protein